MDRMLERLKVLVVDDEPTVREVVAGEDGLPVEIAVPVASLASTDTQMQF